MKKIICQQNQERIVTSVSVPRVQGKAMRNAAEDGETNTMKSNGRQKETPRASRLFPIVYENPIRDPNRSNWETRNPQHKICPQCRQRRTVEKIAVRLPSGAEVFACMAIGCGNGMTGKPFSWEELPPTLYEHREKRKS